MFNNYDNLTSILSTLPTSPDIEMSEIIGRDPETCISKDAQKIVKRLHRIKKYFSPILFIGEPGVGKEYFSRLLHQESNSAGGPFLNLDLDEIPASTYGFMLFGDDSVNLPSKDSYIGKILEAQSGTLFLHHIEKLPIHLQNFFLNIIRNNVVLNSTKNTGGKIINQIKTSINGFSHLPTYPVRIIVGTGQDLIGQVAAGKFRRDLFYRLSVFTIEVPPLRKRKEDILPLLNFYLKYYSTILSRPIKKIDLSSLNWVQHYSWPGNIDELKDFVRINLYYSDDKESYIKLRLLPSIMRKSKFRNI